MSKQRAGSVRGYLAMGSRGSGGTRRISKALLSAFVIAATFIFGSASALADSPPAVTIEAPSSVLYTSVLIAGTVNPEGGPSPTFWHFEFSTEPSNEASWNFGFPAYGEIAEGESSGTSPIAVEGVIEGLASSTEYAVRLVAENGFGANHVVTPEPYPTFTTKAVAPAAVSIAAPTSVTAKSAHFSGEINPEAPAGNPAAFEVNWSFSCTPTCPGLSGGAIPADSSSHAVAVDASGLEPNTEYHVILTATNVGGSATAGPVTMTTPALPPRADTLSAGSVEATSANLAARINPLNAPTTYQFEWGSSSSYDNVAPATVQTLSAADDAFHVVTAPLTGLAPATTYHYRIVATNTQTNEVSHGADSTFTTRAVAGPAAGPCPNESSRKSYSAQLPDCRVYEWVSPDSNGAGNQEPSGSASADGSAVQYILSDAPEKAGSASPSNIVVSRRGAGGWTSESLMPPLVAPVTGFLYEETMKASPDYSEAIFGGDQPLAGSASPSSTEAEPFNAYLKRADGTIVALTTKGEKAYPYITGTSTDFSHVFYQICGERQLPSDPLEFGCVGNTYEWVNGALRLLGIQPGVSHTPMPGGAYLVKGPVVSDDGEFAVFKEGVDDYSPANHTPLYLREHSERTVEVSASQRTVEPDPNPAAIAIAAGIAGNGSVVLFTSSSELTNDANTGRTAGAATDKGLDLYAYDVASGKLSDLTVDDNPADEATGANVQQVLGFNHDMSYVYFSATGSLAPGAVGGETNLYVEHEGNIRFIASEAGAGNVYVTPDGRHAAFLSLASLTGYDNRNPQSGTPEGEAFKYDYEGGGITCVSCRPSGAPPTGGATFATGGGFFVGSPGRMLSDDGSRMFFNSFDRIVPQASNGLMNAYEYEDGEVHLISSGDSGYPAEFFAASASGDDVFIKNRGELVAHGSGLAPAIYDARVGGVEPASPAPECEGESCQGTQGAPPSFEAPSSTALSGSGNLVSPPPVGVKRAVKCPKGKKLSHGKCVKVKHKKKARKAKRSSSHRGGK